MCDEQSMCEDGVLEQHLQEIRARDETINKLKNHGFIELDDGKFELKLDSIQNYKYRGTNKARNLWSLAVFSVDYDGLITGFISSSYKNTMYFKNSTFDMFLKSKA